MQLDFNRSGFDDQELKDLYRMILKPRMIEEKMLVLLRQGRISKWFSGYGQEAISVGTVAALDPTEYILTMHRNLGVFTSREVPLNRLFAQFQGKATGFTKGRDRSFHFGTNKHHIVGMISHLGPQLGVADGVALGSKLKGEEKVTAVFTGDGGASEGDFHEALNTAAVWDLPVLFIIENNQWGLSTPSSEQFRCTQFIDKGIGYGMEAHQIDGNNILEVVRQLRQIAEEIRKDPRPVMVEMITFRMRGHEEASGTKYYPDGLIEKWSVKDPVEGFEDFLKKENIINEEYISSVRNEIKEEINSALEMVFSEPDITFDREKELNDVFAPFDSPEIEPTSDNKKNIRLIDAISEGLSQSMERYPELVIMGQDIAEYGGVFKITDGFVKKFGRERVRNTPLCESAIVGTALGLSIKRMKAVMEMQFADFVTEGFTQIVNNLAKIHWRWGQNADVVIRMPTGAGVGAGPFHSQSNEAWFTHTPGLKVVYPSNPADAKGLLNRAIEDPNPVMFFEHKALYRSVYADVPEDYYTLEFGVARVVRKGGSMTLITYGMGVHWALEYLNENPEMDIELIDLRTLVPLDREAIFASVRKTGKALILQEDTLFGGIASDISSMIHEECFEYLDAPVRRLASLDTPVPFAKNLEDGFLSKNRLKEEIHTLLSY